MVDIEDYEDVYELIGNALFQMEKDTDYIAVYSKRDLIAYLFIDLLKGDYDFEYADFDVLDESLVNQIYLMIIRSDCTISVEPAISKNGTVIGHDAKIALIDMDECKQDVIDYCVNSDKKVVLFSKSDDEYDCYTCNKPKDESDISSDNTVYKVNGKPVSKKEYEYKMAEFDKVYRRHLLDICEMMDEMNEWRKLFRW